MTVHNLTVFIGAAIIAVSFAAPASHAQNANPQLLSISCAGCHGPEGRSPATIPPLYGRSAASIAEALRAFRADQRPATVMNRIAKGYTDAEIDGVAREIAANWK
ncbi:MAG: cytochrome C [Rhodospirillales bacterium]|nr:cytochrome C [Rhodospirillales bacterium]